MTKPPRIDQPKEEKAKPSLMDGFEASPDSAAPDILEAVERMVEQRRRRINEKRGGTSRKKANRNRSTT